jgi:hypothetical protein
MSEDLIEPHEPISDCDCRSCACRERDKLRALLVEWLDGEYDYKDFLRRVKLAAHSNKPRVSLASLRGMAQQRPT